MTNTARDERNELREHVLSIIHTIENGTDELNCDDEPMTGFDYVADALDIEWILNNDRTLKGARVLVAFGGPNIWIDTAKRIVEGYWWGDSFVASYHRDEMDIESALEEIFNC